MLFDNIREKIDNCSGEIRERKRRLSELKDVQRKLEKENKLREIANLKVQPRCRRCKKFVSREKAVESVKLYNEIYCSERCRGEAWFG